MLHRVSLSAAPALLSILLILIMLAGGILFTLLLSLGDQYAGPLSNPAGLHNYLGFLRTYLFRNAAKNTLLVAVLVAPLSVLLAAWLVRSLRADHLSQRIALPVLLSPIFVSPAVAGLAWQVPLTGILAMREANIALLLIGIALLWRTLPLASGILWFARDKLSSRYSYLVAALASTVTVLVDAGSVLMLTGGGPFNASHTWASWLFQNIWVTRNWGQAAAMAITLSAAVGVAAVGIAWLVTVGSTIYHAGSDSSGTRSRLHVLILVLAVGFILMPALFAWRTAYAAVLSADSETLVQAGFVGWLENSLMIALGTAALASLLVLPAVPSVAHSHTRSLRVAGALTLVCGLLVFPIWFVPLARLHAANLLPDDRVALTLVFGATVAAMSLWPGSLIWRHAVPRLNRLLLIARMVGMLSLFVIVQDFGATITVNPDAKTAVLGSGIVLYLARNVMIPSALPLAILISIGLSLLLGIALAQMISTSSQ